MEQSKGPQGEPPSWLPLSNPLSDSQCFHNQFRDTPLLKLALHLHPQDLNCLAPVLPRAQPLIHPLLDALVPVVAGERGGPDHNLVPPVIPRLQWLAGNPRVVLLQLMCNSLLPLEDDQWDLQEGRQLVPGPSLTLIPPPPGRAPAF